MTSINTAQCAYNAASRRLWIDASSAGLRPGETPETLQVESHKTGQTLPFYLDRPTFAGGELMSWEYVNTGSGLRLTVLND